MKGEDVQAIIRTSTLLAKQAAKEQETQEKPGRRRYRWRSQVGDESVEQMAHNKQLLIPRNQQSLHRGHEDAAAQARRRGEAPLLPNERPVPEEGAARGRYLRAMRTPHQVRRDIPAGAIRAADYDKPFLPTAEFVEDSISPSEMNVMGPPAGAPDFRYGNATFPNDDYMGYSGTEGRYLAELSRMAWGAPPLASHVDPLTSGPSMPTQLEQALMALKAAGLRR